MFIIDTHHVKKGSAYMRLVAKAIEQEARHIKESALLQAGIMQLSILSNYQY